ncbi:MAG: type II/IV secretion system protein [Gammaproteobacteria bacterium]|nr:type II/IV secretion system protein [Gammaproteobacteria bacterium]
MTADTTLELSSLLNELEAAGILDHKQVMETRGKARPLLEKGLHPLAVIAELRFTGSRPPHRAITIEVLSEWLAAKAGLPYRRIDPLRIDVDVVTSIMSSAFAVRHQILAVEADGKSVTIATAEPGVRSWEHNLAHVLRNREIKRVIASPVAIKRFIGEFYSISRSVRGAANEGTGERALTSNLEQLIELGVVGDLDANDQHTVKIVDWLLQYAFDQRASDIHIEPRRDKGNVRFRIDGVLHSVYEFPATVTNAITSRFKILGRMDVAEKRRPLDGRIKTKMPSGLEVELRLSTLPTAFGEKLVMRIFDPSVLVRPFVDLGLSPEDEALWKQMVGHSTGIVLVTGPTGSGKTTTLYTTLKMLATSEVNVCTIEDPIEMVEGSFNQMQVQHDIGVNFATGVRALLRQDPDIIMVGEIRDMETAEMAIQASLTGHLVLSTLHTNDAPSAITRLIEIGVAPYLINATVLGVMAQRLVRVLCPHCKEKVNLEPTAWIRLVKPVPLAIPEFVYKPVGCQECRHTGYLGRQGIYEILRMSPALHGSIKREGDVGPIRQQAMKDGMQMLRISGAHKVAAGLTTIEEVLRVAPMSDAD